MKKMLLALLCLAFLSSGAQTVDEVIQKYAANLGGLDAFNKIKSAKFSGNFSAQGNDFAMTIQVINRKAVRSEIDVMGSLVINVYKDGKGWKQNPLAGITTPTEATATEVSELKVQSMLAPVLMDYKARGHQVELLGQEDVEGIKTFKIKLTSKDDSKVTTYYISAADYMLIKSATEREFQGQTVTVESWYSDLKEINSVKVFMSRVQKIDGEEFQAVKLDKVEFDLTIDEKIFDMP